MKELAVRLCMESDRPAVTHADTINALRIWGNHDIADDFATVLLMMPVKECSGRDTD